MPDEVKSLPININVQMLQQLQNDGGEEFLFVDCREPSEHATARIPGTVLMPMGTIPGRLADFEPFRQKRIVIHCHHGGRSMRVVQWLRQQGFEGAQNMAGGIDEWSLEIDPSVPRYE